MIEQNDLQQIKEIVKETAQGTEKTLRDEMRQIVQESEKRILGTTLEMIQDSEKGVIASIGEMVEQQILPRLDHLEQEMERLRKDVTYLQSQMVTKEYLDVKLADEFSDFYNRLKREWWSKDVQWKQRVMRILQNANIAKPEDIQELESLIGI